MGPAFVFLYRLGMVAAPENGGDDPTGGDAIDTHPEFCQLSGPDLGDMDDSRFARGIERTGAIGRHSGCAAVVDDAAAALLFHDRGHIFETKETGAEIRHHHSVEILQSELFRRDKALPDAGIVEQHIHSPPLLHCGIDQGLHIGFDGNVGAFENRILTQAIGQCLSCFLTTGRDHHPGPFGHE